MIALFEVVHDSFYRTFSPPPPPVSPNYYADLLTNPTGDKWMGPDETWPDGLDPETRVVVPTGHGERYHRPGGLGFETACKTGFSYPVRETTLARAREEGYSACKVPACFGDDRP